MSANFTVYRRGAAAFTINSRVQGSVRKATSAKYTSKLMNDESISLTVLSSVMLDFRLRDYIIFKNKPYMLNLMPDVSVDTSKLYTYNVKFEGAMYELGRVAFLLDNAFGYDFYGTLADFCRLVVGNMNRVNKFVEWDEYETDPLVATTHYARQSGVTSDGKVIWGNLNGDDPSGDDSIRWSHGFVSWIKTDNANPLPNSNPIGSSRAATPPVIKKVHEWKLDFPKKTTIPAVYPTPVYYSPENIQDTNIHWPDPANPIESQYIVHEDYRSMAMANERTEFYDYITDPNNPFDTIPTKKIVYSVSDISAASPIPTPSHACQSIGEVATVNNLFSYIVTKKTYHLDNVTENWTLYDTSNEGYTRPYSITFTATGTQGTTWQIQNVTPQSGSVTSYDFETAENLLSYDNHSCLAVLNDICSQWDGWEWYIDGDECSHYNGEMLVNATIHMILKDDNKTNVTHNMNFGRKGGLSLISRKHDDDANIPSKIYFYGGSKNLPQYYRNTRLCLPNADKTGSYIDLTYIHGYPLSIAITNRTCEEVKLFDDIYPANKPFVIGNWGISFVSGSSGGSSVNYYLQLTIPESEFFSLTSKWTMGEHASFPRRALTDSDIDDYPDFFEWLKMKNENDEYDQSTQSSPQRERYLNYYVYEHVSKYLIGGEKPMFTFQTGKIAGYSLSVHEISIQTIKEGRYYVVLLNTVKEDNSELDSPLDEGHKYVPNLDLCPVHGDKFIIENINMPVSYTYYKDGSSNDHSAENQLWKAAMDYVDFISEKINYEIEVSRGYALSKDFNPSVRDVVCFDDVLSDGSSVTKRITELELDLVDGYSYKIVINNGVVSSNIRKLKNIVSTVTKPNAR